MEYCRQKQARTWQISVSITMQSDARNQTCSDWWCIPNLQPLDCYEAKWPISNLAEWLDLYTHSFTFVFSHSHYFQILSGFHKHVTAYSFVHNGKQEINDRLMVPLERMSWICYSTAAMLISIVLVKRWILADRFACLCHYVRFKPASFEVSHLACSEANHHLPGNGNWISPFYSRLTVCYERDRLVFKMG